MNDDALKGFLSAVLNINQEKYQYTESSQGRKAGNP